MPSFDIVSKVDLSELKNAILNSMKEIGQRYDFKGSISQIELETDCVVVITEDDLKAKQVNEILLANLIRRKVDPKVIRELSREPASGNTIRIRFEIVQGIQKEEAKLIEELNNILGVPIPFAANNIIDASKNIFFLFLFE